MKITIASTKSADQSRVPIGSVQRQHIDNDLALRGKDLLLNTKQSATLGHTRESRAIGIGSRGVCFSRGRDRAPEWRKVTPGHRFIPAHQ